MEIEITIGGRRAYAMMLRYKIRIIAEEYGAKIDYFFVNGKWPRSAV